MARYRKIDVRMTLDEKYRRLSPPKPCGQALWWYLLVNPETTNIPGLFRAGEAQLAEALGWSVEGFRRSWAEIEREGMARADWKARVVWIPNAIRYNAPESRSVVTGWRTAWDEIPECPMREAARQGIRTYLATMGEGWAETWDAACAPSSATARRSPPKPAGHPDGQAGGQSAGHPAGQPVGQSGPHQEQEQEQEQEQDPDPPSGEAGGQPPGAAAGPRRRREPSPREAVARLLGRRLGSASHRTCLAQVTALLEEGWDLDRVRDAIDQHAAAGLAPWDWTRLAKGTAAPPRHGGLTGEQIRRMTERPADPDVLALGAGGAP